MGNLTEEQRSRKRARERKGPLSREEAKAKKHQQMMVSERKKSPEGMWDELLDGQVFGNYRIKKAL